MQGALALSAEAAALARTLGDTLTLAHCLYARRYVLWGLDDAAERARLIEATLAAARAADADELLLLARRWRICDALEAGDLPLLDAELALQARLAAVLCRPYLLWLAAIYATLRSVLDGRLGEAERLLHEGLTLGTQAQAIDAHLTFALQRFALRWEQGRLPDSAPLFQQATAECGALPLYRALAALLAAALGDAQHSAALLDDLLRDGPDAFPRDALWLPTFTVAAVVCDAIGAARHAPLLKRALAPYTGRLVLGGNAIALLGPVDYALGLLAALQGAWPRAARHHAAALALAERCGARTWAARARAARATAARSAGLLSEQATQTAFTSAFPPFMRPRRAASRRLQPTAAKNSPSRPPDTITANLAQISRLPLL